MVRRPFVRHLLIVLVIVLLFGSSPATLRADEHEPPAATRQERLEAVFAEMLSGAELVGSYTTDGQEGEPPAEERYEISRVQKAPSGKWLFLVRVQFGEVDVNLPMSLDVEWADDTPVISLTNLTLPGLGTFSSRVLFYGDRYAGTWQHGEVGGHLFGRVLAKETVVKESDTEENDEAESPDDSDEE